MSSDFDKRIEKKDQIVKHLRRVREDNDKNDDNRNEDAYMRDNNDNFLM